MTFLTILGITEILCSFRLVIERKTGKKIPESSRLEFLQKFSANNFALSDAEDNTSGSLNRRGKQIYLLWEHFAIHQKSWETSFWKVIDTFVLLAYASFAASRTFFQQLLAGLNFRIRFFLLLQTKKWFLWTMATAQAAENHGDEWGLTWYFLWGIYTSIPTWTQNSLKAAEAASLNISSHGTPLKWSQRMSQ